MLYALGLFKGKRGNRGEKESSGTTFGLRSGLCYWNASNIHSIEFRRKPNRHKYIIYSCGETFNTENDSQTKNCTVEIVLNKKNNIVSARYSEIEN